MKKVKLEEIIGLWASETHYLIIRENLIEYCVKHESPILIEYPRMRYYANSVSISDSCSICGITNDDDMIFEIDGQIINMNRINK